MLFLVRGGLFSVEKELFLVVKYKFGVSIDGHSARGRPQAGRALSKAQRPGLKMPGLPAHFEHYPSTISSQLTLSSSLSSPICSDRPSPVYS